ncbi:MAG: hypothetical protein ACYDH6_19840 [Acidimicrobiales bacterium]
MDEDRHLLYVAGAASGLQSAQGGPVGTITVIDGRTAAVVGTIPIPDVDGSQRQSAALGGLSYDRARQRLYALVGLNVVDELDPHGCLLSPTCVHTGAGFVKWSFQVAGCGGFADPLANIPGVPADPGRQELYVFCTNPSLGTVTAPRPTQGVYVVHTANDQQPTGASFFAVPGDFNFGGVLFDPGSERMIMLSRRFGPGGAYVFDGPHHAVVGIVEQNLTVVGACLDVATGRYYVSDDAAFYSAQARATPAQAGTADPSLAQTAQGPAACDPVSHRVFVAHAEANGSSYLVLQDNSPPYVAVPRFDPDALTHNVSDDPATSIVTYTAFGRAIGARVTDVGGPGSLVTSFAQTSTIEQGAGAVGPIVDPAIGATNSDATRWLTAAQVGVGQNSVTLADTGTQAAAIGSGRDSYTANNFTANGSRQDSWPYTEASCSRAAGDDATTDTRSAVSATCQPDTGQPGSHPQSSATAGPVIASVASASGAPSADGPTSAVVAIRDASASVEAHTDPKLGVVATSTASVGTVSLGGGQVVLQDVTGTAISSARGLPGTATTSYTRRIGSMVVGGQKVCAPCDPTQVQQGLATSPDQDIQVILPNYDRDLARGTPMGAASAIVRDPYEQLNDEVLNQLPPEDQQVPALRLVIEPRAFQQAVLLVDLAAPEAVAFRGISPCAFCSPDTTPTTTPAVTGPELTAGGAKPPTPPKTHAPTKGAPTKVMPAPKPAAKAARPALSRALAMPAPPIGSIGRRIAPNVAQQFLRSLVSPAVLPLESSTSSPPLSTSVLQQVPRGIAAIERGVKAVFTSPRRLPLVVLVWSVLAIPVYLSSRRKLVVLRGRR